ncbi:MAG TPA: diacylglycerol kinase family protein [Casimicrobiaceae bacterium]|nr:diacylglycerol kinase family protein [Casimicrobiaceae bacterium]
MRVALVYNPTAGDGQGPDLEDVLALIRGDGHDVRYRSSKDTHLGAFLARPADLVAVAGGDGTIAQVAKALRRKRTPIAPLPTGTANNICTALGLTRLTLREQVSGWKTADARRFDIGEVSGPWGLRYFVESVGVGMIPRMIIAAQRDGSGKRKGKRRRNARAIRLAVRHLRDCPGIALDARIDGRSCEGRFLLFEVMNISLVGPNLCLATSADPTDRLFDVVVVREFERELLRECLEAEEEGAAWPHELTTIRGSRLEFASGGFPVHVDDEIYLRTSGDGRRGAPIRLAMRQGVTMLLPRAA